MRGPEEQIRALWVIPTISARFGGPTTTAVNGLVAERRAGLASEVATTIGHDEAPEDVPAVRRLREEGVEVHAFRRIALLERGEAWGLSGRLAWWLIRNVRRYEVIHLQYVWCMTSIVGAVVARLSGVPVVVTPHESLTDFDIDVASRRDSLRRMKQVLRHLYLRTANRLVFMSELEKDDTRHDRTDAEIIAHAVLDETTDPPRLDRPDDRGLRIAFLGRNIEKKGIHLIVEAMAREPERDWQLLVAGPPGEPEYIERVSREAERLGVEDRVEWLGYVPSRAEFLAGCDLLAMPSVYEGFGMVAAEAMCVGIPVIVPRRSGVAEVASEYDAGVVMPSSSTEQVRRALIRLDDDRGERIRMGANGRRAAEERLSYAAFAAQTAATYRSLGA